MSVVKIEVDWGAIKGWLCEWLICSWRGHRFIPFQKTEYCRLCGQWGEIRE